jgi:hypothetical protein
MTDDKPTSADLCSACAARMDQAKRDGKLGTIICEACADRLRVDPLDVVEIGDLAERARHADPRLVGMIHRLVAGWLDEHSSEYGGGRGSAFDGIGYDETLYAAAKLLRELGRDPFGEP